MYDWMNKVSKKYFKKNLFLKKNGKVKEKIANNSKIAVQIPLFKRGALLNFIEKNTKFTISGKKD